MTWKSKAAHFGAHTALALTLLTTVSTAGSAQTPVNPWGGQKGPGQYADVNGIKLYYELHGQSRDASLPLVLLHGGLGAGSMFGANLTALAKGRQVILVDLQGHGRTADIDRPMTLEAMSDDIAALLARLHIAQADVMGYSLGGGVALQTAVRHPELVRRLVLVSTVIRSNAYYPEMRAQQTMVGSAIAESMQQTPMYQLYKAVAPRPQDFPRLLDKIGALMKTDFDYTSQVAALKPFTLFVAGDADMFPISHVTEVFALLDGGKRDGGWDGSGRSKRAQLAILPGQTHYTTFSAPSLVAVAIPFLDAK